MTQLQALGALGPKKPAGLPVIKPAVLIVNGDDDRTVPTSNSHDPPRRISNSALVIYPPDAGHGGVLQNQAAYVPQVLDFLGR